MERSSLITILLTIFIALLGIGIIIPVMPVLADSLGAGGVALGMIIAAFSIVRGLAQPVVGNLSDLLGGKWFMVAGLFIYGLVGLLIPHAASVNDLIIIRAFQGLGSAMIVPIALAYVSILAPVGQEGRYMGYLNIAMFCGIGCGPIFGGLFLDTLGVAAAFYAMAVLSFAAFVLVFCNMPASLPQEGVTAAGLLPSLAKMVRRRRTVGILLARYATMIVMVPTMAFLPILMMQWGPHVTGTEVGLVIAARTLVNAILQVPCGKLADSFNKIPLLLGGSLGMGISLSLVPHSSGLMQMIALYAMLGVGEALIWPVLGVYASEEGRAHFGHGTMMGVYSLAMSGGVFTGAMLAGYATDNLGMSWAYYLTALAVCLITMIAAIMIYQGEQADRTESPKR